MNHTLDPDPGIDTCLHVNRETITCLKCMSMVMLQYLFLLPIGLVENLLILKYTRT